MSIYERQIATARASWLAGVQIEELIGPDRPDLSVTARRMRILIREVYAEMDGRLLLIGGNPWRGERA